MWYTSLTGGPNSDAPKVFEAKYPGVKLEVYRGDSDAIIQRVLQEAQAKRFLVDTIETTFPVLKVMQENKLLAPYFSPHLAQYPDEAKEKAEKGLVYWATDRESYIGLAYNTNSVPGQRSAEGLRRSAETRAARQDRFCHDGHRRARHRRNDQPAKAPSSCRN